MPRLRTHVALLVAAVAIASCGSDRQPRAGEKWCQELQDRGLLLEPMAQCLDEYDQAQRTGTQP